MWRGRNRWNDELLATHVTRPPAAYHRVRSRLVSRRTATINQIRAFLIEQGIAVRVGYGIEGRRITRWIVDGVIKYHRTIAAMLNVLHRVGFAYVSLDEGNHRRNSLPLTPSGATPNSLGPCFCW